MEFISYFESVHIGAGIVSCGIHGYCAGAGSRGGGAANPLLQAEAAGNDEASFLALALRSATQYSPVGGTITANEYSSDNIAIGQGSAVYNPDAWANGNIAIGVDARISANSFDTPASLRNSIAIGYGAKATQSNAVVLGTGYVYAEGGTAIGTGAHVTVDGTNSVAIGAGSVAAEENVVSVGTEDERRKIINVADAENDYDAVNFHQMKDYVRQNLGSGGSGGGLVFKDEQENIVAGTEGGSQLKLNADGSFSLLDKNGRGLLIDTSGSLLFNQDGQHSLTLGSIIQQEIQNQGAGGSAADVQDLKDKIGSGELHNHATTLTDGINANTEAISQNKEAIAQNREAIASVGRNVHRLGEEIDSVGAISAALAGLHPLDYDGTNSKYQIAAAMGTYDGTSALALGGFYSFSENARLSLGVSTSLQGEKKTAGNLGVTFRVGPGSSSFGSGEAGALADVRQRVLSLQDENTALVQQNQKLEARVTAQEKKLADQDALVQSNRELKEKVAQQDQKLNELQAVVQKLLQEKK